MFKQLENEINMLPAAILEAMLHHRFFDYTQLMNRKESIQKFLRMNGGSNADK